MSSTSSYGILLPEMRSQVSDSESVFSATSSDGEIIPGKVSPLLPKPTILRSYMNTNQNANTEDEEANNSQNTPKKRPKSKRKSTDTDSETEIGPYQPDLYTNSTICSNDIPDTCEHKEFAESIIAENTTTKYSLPTTRRKLHQRRVKYISAVVMAQCTIDGNVMPATIKLNDQEIPCMIPTGPIAVDKATSKVLKSEVNATKKCIYDTYPFLPLNHDLPCVEIQKHKYGKWRKHTPVEVTVQNTTVFMYAPTNMRINGHTYAANCRHPTSHWDEHPWCILCLLKANLEPCIGSDTCYICQRMGPNATRLRKAKITYWKNRLQKKEGLEWSRSNLPGLVSTQLQCDFYNKTIDDEMNPDWQLGYFGYCRPGWHVPIYYSWHDFYMSLRNKSDLETEIHLQLQDFRVEYENLKQVKRGPLWSPLPKRKIRRSTKRKLEVDDVYTSGDGGDERSDDEQQDQQNQDTNYQQDDYNQDYSQNTFPTSNPYKQWSARGQYVTIMAPDDSKRRDPTEPILAAARLRKEKVDLALPAELQGEDAIFNDLEAEPRAVYPINDRMSSYIDTTLQSYKSNAYDPELNVHLPISYDDYRNDGKIQCYATMCAATPEGYLPYEHDTVTMSQREITALDTVNRATVKINEVDAYLFPALTNFATQYERSRTGEERAKGTSDITKIINQLRHNFLQRERLLATNTGIVQAVRRRDNAEQHRITGDDINTVVSRPLDDRAGGTLL